MNKIEHDLKCHIIYFYLAVVERMIVFDVICLRAIRYYQGRHINKISRSERTPSPLNLSQMSSDTEDLDGLDMFAACRDNIDRQCNGYVQLHCM